MTPAEARVRMRGEILRVVRRFGTVGISFGGLETVFKRAGRVGVVSELEEQIQYLTDKGYLAKELKTDALSSVERWLLWITPQGMDLLDEIIGPDPGVEIVC